MDVTASRFESVAQGAVAVTLLQEATADVDLTGNIVRGVAGVDFFPAVSLLAMNAATTLEFDVVENTIVDVAVDAIRIHAYGSVSGRFTGNAISDVGETAIVLDQLEGGLNTETRLSITDNQIGTDVVFESSTYSGVGANGIQVLSAYTPKVLHMTVTGNTIANVGEIGFTHLSFSDALTRESQLSIRENDVAVIEIGSHGPGNVVCASIVDNRSIRSTSSRPTARHSVCPRPAWARLRWRTTVRW